MASKKDKRIGIVLGLIIGLIKGREYTYQNNISQEEHWMYLLSGGMIGASFGYYAALILGSPNDTVNYSLFKNGKLVYHGIAYENRLKKRRAEHIKRGLKFDKMLRDKPKARLDAMILEKRRIKKHRPVYNIQHNNDNI